MWNGEQTQQQSRVREEELDKQIVQRSSHVLKGVLDDRSTFHFTFHPTIGQILRSETRVLRETMVLSCNWSKSVGDKGSLLVRSTPAAWFDIEI